ncbi:class I SAM-dependent DNA methyltransferase [Halopseudomonas litoralis]|uniref:class I SAM-dependent DNA methyltransferase n=1 Tax=Halopseudomonas litoralis TaxID=797277 RepID=UPI0012FDE920|nr:methyltransferase domain-containing protein [Halopseudomonas litoralis]
MSWLNRGQRPLIDSADYYDTHSEQFYRDTVGVNMDALYARFLQHVPVGKPILDAGCGSGRDATAFKGLGYPVGAFDASEAMAIKASELLGQSVAVQMFEQFKETPRYGGIWACASLLHVPETKLPEAFSRLWEALLGGGVLYCSFKCSGQLIPDTVLSFSSATAGASPPLKAWGRFWL